MVSRVGQAYTNIMKKKVLYIVTKSTFGGAQRYVYDLATSLPKGVGEPVVVAGGTGILHEKLELAGVRSISIDTLERDVHLGKEIVSAKTFFSIIKNEKPDVIHLSSPKAGGLGALIGRIFRVPTIIYTAHGWPFLESRNFIWRTIVWIASWMTALLSHTVIVISSRDLELGKRMPFCSKKMRLIHNGVDSFDLIPRDQARVMLFSNDDISRHGDDIWVISNAELTPNKNLFVGIDAVASHNKSHNTKIFYSIMSGGELQGELQKHIEKNKLSEHVRLLGFVQDGRSFLKAFDISFLPSKKEGLPYALLEAGVAKHPTVASNVGGIPDIIQNGKTGLLGNPSDTKSFVKHLHSLSESTSLQRTLGEALNTHVHSTFSKERMLSKTFSLY